MNTRSPKQKGAYDFSEYDGMPWLTALANFCLVIGVFVGTYAAIFLAGYLHRGPRVYWPLILILAVDIALNTLFNWRDSDVDVSSASPDQNAVDRIRAGGIAISEIVPRRAHPDSSHPLDKRSTRGHQMPGRYHLVDGRREF